MEALVETSRFIPTSEVDATLIAPNTAHTLVNCGHFTINTIQEESRNIFIDGNTHLDGQVLPTSILITEPGIISRAIAKVRRKEPMAVLNLEIRKQLDTSPEFSKLV